MGKLNLVAVAAAMAGMAGAAEYPERWFQINASVNKPGQLETFTNAVAKAKTLGYTAVFWSGGVDYASCWSNESRQKYVAARDFCRSVGMEIVPSIWSIGYGCMMNYGYDLMEGVHVAETEYVAGTGKATGVVRPAAFGGRGFAFVDGLSGKKRWTFVDEAVKREGATSLRFDLDDAQSNMSRFSHEFHLKPDARYRYTFWLKTDNVSHREITLYMNARDPRIVSVHGGHQTWKAKLRPTQDWTRYSFDFNTAVESNLVCYCGFWQKGKGRMWVADAKVEEVPPQAILRNPGSPVRLVDAQTGAVYAEGKDYVVPKVKARRWAWTDPFADLEIPAGSAIKPGTRLKLDCYTPAVCFENQVSLCVSNPRLYEVLETSARTIKDLLGPRVWNVSLDEVRNGNTCALCQSKGTDMAHLQAECFRKMYDIIRKVDPKAEISMWNDMIDPFHNAHDRYYCGRGSWAGIADMIPRDVIVLDWCHNHNRESLNYFSKRGFRTMYAGYYDARTLDADRTRIVENCNNTPGCIGMLFSTWCDDFGKAKEFMDIVRNEGRLPPPAVTPRRQFDDRWFFAIKDLAEDKDVEELKKLVATAAASGYNGLVLTIGRDYMMGTRCSGPRAFDAAERSRVSGFEDFSNWDAAKSARYDEVARACKAAGIEIIPLVWSPGYCSMRHADPNLVAAQPVRDVPYVAGADGKATFAGGSRRKLGLSLAGGLGRIDEKVDVKPYRAYRIRYRMKGENLGGTPSVGVQLFAYGEGDGHDRGALRPWNRAWGASHDWTEVSYDFNSGHFDRLTIYLGSWGIKTGKLWIEDVVLEELGVQNAVSRASTPFVVKDAKTGRPYREGKDYVAPAKMTELWWGGAEKMAEISLPKGSRIKPGTELLVDAFEPIAIMDKQFSVCMTDPDLKAYFERTAAAVKKRFGNAKWFLSSDEIRAGCRCGNCLREKNFGKIFGKTFTDQYRAIQKADPGATVYLWFDMLSPLGNAKHDYYMIPGEFVGAHELVPRELVMVPWGAGKGRHLEALKWCADRGFRTLAATYYDEPTLDGSRHWLQQCNQTPECRGIMYTPWANHYDLLPDFGKMLQTDSHPCD